MLFQFCWGTLIILLCQVTTSLESPLVGFYSSLNNAFALQLLRILAGVIWSMFVRH